AAIGKASEMMTSVLLAAKEPTTGRIRSLALMCIAFMARRATLLTQLVDAGVIPLLLKRLQMRDLPLTANDTISILDAIGTIAKASRANRNAMLVAGALSVMLPVVRADISANVCHALFSALSHLMSGRPAAEMAAA